MTDLNWPFLPKDQPAWNQRGDEPWDWQTQGFSGTGKHEGRDYGLAQGSPYYASADGVVVDHQVGWVGGGGGGWGTHLVIDYGDDVQIRTAHMDQTFVKLGERVTRGQKIGTSGNTGTSTGPHLHLEVRRGFRRGGARGTVLDPATMLVWPSVSDKPAPPVPPVVNKPPTSEEDDDMLKAPRTAWKTKDSGDWYALTPDGEFRYINGEAALAALKTPHEGFPAEIGEPIEIPNKETAAELARFYNGSPAL